MTDHTTIPGRSSHGTVRLADLPGAATIELEQALAAGDWEPELAPRGWPVVEGDSGAATIELEQALAAGDWEPELAPRGWSVVEGDSGATGEYL